MPHLTKYIVNNGYVFNHVFLAITGYGLSKKIKDGNEGKVWARNEISLFAMFIPVFIVGWATYIILVNHDIISAISTVYGAGGIYGVFCFFLDMFGIGDAFGMPLLNPTWWYLSVMQLSVLALIVMYLFLKNKDNVIYVYIACILWIGYAFQTNLYLDCLLACLGGAVIAQCKIIERFENNNKTKVVGVLLSILLFVIWHFLKGVLYAHYVSAICLPLASFLIIHFVVAKIPIISNGLSIIGVYSGLIFMIHTFIYMILPPISQFVYRTKYALVSYLLVLFISFGVSFIIKLIEDKTGYTNFVNKMKERIAA